VTILSTICIRAWTNSIDRAALGRALKHFYLSYFTQTVKEWQTLFASYCLDLRHKQRNQVIFYLRGKFGSLGIFINLFGSFQSSVMRATSRSRPASPSAVLKARRPWICQPAWEECAFAPIEKTLPEKWWRSVSN